jgi:hypothetical protein
MRAMLPRLRDHAAGLFATAGARTGASAATFASYAPPTLPTKNAERTATRHRAMAAKVALTL